MKILIYDYKENFTLMDENKAIEVFEFEMPKDRAMTIQEFESIEHKIDYEGYAYTILKEDGSLYCSGIYTADSLYDDLIIAPSYVKSKNS